MSDTPETEKACLDIQGRNVVYVEFAEKLERERDEARREAEKLQLKYWGAPPYSKKY